MDENFPTFEEFSENQPGGRGPGAHDEPARSLPQHRVFINSPLHGNFLFFTLAGVALALGYTRPELAPVLIYGAIGLALVVALFFTFRDSLFFHFEGSRLVADAEMISRHARGPEGPGSPQPSGLLGLLVGAGQKGRNSKVFRSKLLQIHYQNVVRTFEQGNRRAWVTQEASIGDLHVLVSQRGMKIVWTLIEMLPQLGLLGTLIGLVRMFLAFRSTAGSPDLEVLAGFGTALGTTVLANVMVLMLRPLYMRNDRSMNEILSTVQSLMATFILPTQQSVLDRSAAVAMATSPLSMSRSSTNTMAMPVSDGSRIQHTLDDLAKALTDFTETQQTLNSGRMAKDTAAVAKEVREMLANVQEAMPHNTMDRQRVAVEELSAVVRQLSATLGHGGAGASGGRIEHDLMQLRVLNRDTLVLLEQIAGQLSRIGASSGRLLSKDETLRAQTFGESVEPGATKKGRRPGKGS